MHSHTGSWPSLKLSFTLRYWWPISPPFRLGRTCRPFEVCLKILHTQNLRKAGLQSSVISACSQGKVYQQPPLTVLPGGNSSAVDFSDLIMGREVLPLKHLRLSDEVTLLTEPDKPVGHGCSMTRKERGPDSPREQGTLTPLKATRAGSWNVLGNPGVS